MSDSAADSGAVSPKNVVREVLDRLPENATFREIAEEIAILTALVEGAEDIRAGRVSSHTDVKHRAFQWRNRR
jgi:predicted transcriptional regulator